MNSFPITGERFCNIMTLGPIGLQETLWYWLYQEGLVKVPFAWHSELLQWRIDLTKYRIGIAFLPVIQSTVTALHSLMDAY